MGSETGTNSGPCKLSDIYNSSRALEFMGGMEGEDPVKKEEIIAKFKETHSYLFDCYDDWIKEDQILDAETSYYIATEMLKKHSTPPIDEDTLNSFLESIYDEETEYKGIFISAMINTLYENERISIYPDGQKISYIGMNNEEKEIFVWGWLHDFAGINMKGGSMEIMQGVSGIGIGKGMEGGKISISDAHGYEVNTDTQLSQNIKSGEIYYNDRRVWPETTFLEPVKKLASKLFS